MKQKLNYMHEVNPAEDKPKTKTVTAQLIDKGIIIDDILYKPMKYAGDIWEQCNACDCSKPCYNGERNIALCGSFGEDTILVCHGKIVGFTITNQTIEDYERYDKD